MRRVISALLLSILITAGTSAHMIEPIKPVPKELFKPVGPYPTIPIIVDLDRRPDPSRPVVEVPISEPIVVAVTPRPNVSIAGFLLDRNVSWYGPGFYGKRTACGWALTKEIKGVAHKTLPCGTRVTFKYKASDGVTRSITVPVIDRGPYVGGRQWDLSGGLCVFLHHCFTGSIYYRIGK